MRPPFLVPITVLPRDAASGASHLSATIVSALVHDYVSTTLFRFVIFVFRPIVACQFSLLSAILPRRHSRFSRFTLLERAFWRWCRAEIGLSLFINRIACVCLLPFLDPFEVGWHACLTERLTSATELLVKATARLPLWAFAKSRERASPRSAQRVAPTEKKCERATEENIIAIRPIDQERGSLLSRSQTCRAFLTARSISLMPVVSRWSDSPKRVSPLAVAITLCEEVWTLGFMSFLLFYLIYMFSFIVISILQWYEKIQMMITITQVVPIFRTP